MSPDSALQPSGNSHRSRSIGVRFVVLIGIVSLLAGAVGWWAVASVFHTASNPAPARPFLVATVTRGSVGASIDVDASTTWSSGFAARNQATGIVTSTLGASDTPDSPGTVLYTVDLRPVVIAQGDVPSFRELAAGMTGPDVSQLQSLLRSIGRYFGPTDGRFTPSLQSSVVAWHRALGMGTGASVETGDIVYVPRLPSRVALSASLISVGDSVSGGEAGIKVFSSSPAFSMVLTPSQASLIPPRARVTLHPSSGGSWHAQVSSVVSGSNGVTISLKPFDTSFICDTNCSEISTAGTTLVPATVVTTPTITGLALPTAAIQTDARNRSFVDDPKGIGYRVQVLGSSDGISVVTGVRLGMRVRIPVLSAEQ